MPNELHDLAQAWIRDLNKPMLKRPKYPNVAYVEFIDGKFDLVVNRNTVASCTSEQAVFAAARLLAYDD